MAVRKLNPITPGQRFRVVTDFVEVTTDKPEKSLLAGRSKSGGRNSDGKMTMRYIGGGHKQRYRIIDFKRNKDGIPATVKPLNMIQIVRHILHCCFMQTERKRYAVAQNGLKDRADYQFQEIK